MVCTQCPRNCGIDRKINSGFCRMPEEPIVARAGLHFWEEPCISGTKGSGTVFFSGCSLKCVFCQNGEISHRLFGKQISVERLADIFKELENMGAHNINLVNPTHYVHAIKQAVDIYKPNIPFVYNSGGYDTVETIEIASQFVDIFLMDMKYFADSRAEKYSKAIDYPIVCQNAILKCADIIKENIFDDEGIMKKGLIIRHLILPQGTNDAINVVNWINNNVPWSVLSLMGQYTPCGDLIDFKEINRKITRREYDKVLSFAEDTNIEIIYTQELNSSGQQFIPSFDLSGV